MCPWCQNKKGKTDLSFGVIDDDAGQYVKGGMIEYCPFCGRGLNETTSVLEKVIKLIKEEYESATKNPYVKDPLAFTLYHVWRKVDSGREKDTWIIRR